MNESEQPRTSTKRIPSPIVEGFLYGFFTMAGGLLCMSVFNNRHKIKRVIHYAIQEAR